MERRAENGEIGTIKGLSRFGREQADAGGVSVAG